MSWSIYLLALVERWIVIAAVIAAALQSHGALDRVHSPIAWNLFHVMMYLPLGVGGTYLDVVLSIWWRKSLQRWSNDGQSWHRWWNVFGSCTFIAIMVSVHRIIYLPVGTQWLATAVIAAMQSHGAFDRTHLLISWYFSVDDLSIFGRWWNNR